jgi:hypothetical protein
LPAVELEQELDDQDAETHPESDDTAEEAAEESSEFAAELDETPSLSEVFATADQGEQPEVAEEPGEVGDEIDVDVDPNESWWVEPGGKSVKTPTVEAAGDEHEEEGRRGRLGMFSPSRGEVDDFEPVTGESNGDVEEDTEAFLEKVFSQLEEPVETAESPTADDETETEEDESSGHGLLRRRRLGSILTDSTKSND